MTRIFKIIFDGEEHQVEITPAEDSYRVTLAGAAHRFQPLVQEPPLYSFLVDDAEVLEADISFQKDSCQLNLRNRPYHLEVFDPRRRIVSSADLQDGGGTISAPMPGKVVEVKVKEKDAVEKGQAVVVIEAMKMQNELFAPSGGSVKELHVKAGDTVEAGAKLVVIAKE
jgi:biotin carboxyl carrier protein